MRTWHSGTALGCSPGFPRFDSWRALSEESNVHVNQRFPGALARYSLRHSWRALSEDCLKQKTHNLVYGESKEIF